MKNKTSKPKSKPVDTKPKPPIRKPAKKHVKPKMNQRDETQKELLISAIRGVSKMGGPLLVAFARAQLLDEDVVAIPRDVAESLLEVLTQISEDLLDQSGYTLEELGLV
jgi:hypothetical protein